MPSTLRDHRVAHPLHTSDEALGPHLFDLNNCGPPISITDQMARGYQAVLDAWHLHYIGSDKPLLVIGAGAAGMMAAMTAVTKEIPTWVVERTSLWFSTQASCQTRFVCPTQYEWPAAEWQKGFYPHNGDAMPFSWIRGRVAYVVKNPVNTEIRKFMDANPQLRVFTSEFRGFNTRADLNGKYWVWTTLDPEPPDPDYPRAFSMVLACAGFGDENITASRVRKCAAATLGMPEALETGPKPYDGFRFWQNDQYENAYPSALGLLSGKRPNVLISGSGDGALQDFLRIVLRTGATGPDGAHAGALYSKLASSLSPGVQRDMERELLLIETEFRTKLALANKIKDDDTRRNRKCDVYAEADAGHQRVIKGIIENSRAWRQVNAALDKAIRDLRNDISVLVVYPHTHLTAYYGLNRFLMLMISAYAAVRYADVNVLLPNTIVTNVIPGSDATGSSHPCKNAPACHGQAHQVFVSRGDCRAVARGCVQEDERALAGGPFNVIVIRYGITPGSRKDLLDVRRTVGSDSRK